MITGIIQKAIDSCAVAGEGVVIFPKGILLCGGIQLKSNVTLQLDKGAILKGSDKYADYNNDAFIYGKDLSKIAIQGEGVIDGVDCYNPRGEEVKALHRWLQYVVKIHVSILLIMDVDQ